MILYNITSSLPPPMVSFSYSLPQLVYDYARTICQSFFMSFDSVATGEFSGRTTFARSKNLQIVASLLADPLFGLKFVDRDTTPTRLLYFANGSLEFGAAEVERTYKDEEKTKPYPSDPTHSTSLIYSLRRWKDYRFSTLPQYPNYVPGIITST